MKESLAGSFAAITLPKLAPKSPVNETRAQRFEAKASKPASRLRSAEVGTRVAIHLPHEVAEAMRMRCARENRSYSDAATEALRAWLAGGA